ncbi:MAG: YdbH domain-containing protein [Gammaproteobacteria bacterium]|jgi:hypothetical protein|nr:YdbH domain-containing protein [Gammaproteobacteria bacterium]
MINKPDTLFRFLLVALLQLAVVAPSLGDDASVMTGSVTNISSNAWTITGFDSILELTDTGLRGEIHIASIALLESGQVFDDIRVACAAIILRTRTLQCAKATFTVTIPGIGRQAIPGAFTYNKTTGSADIELSSVAIAGGHVRLNITASETGVDVRYTGTQLQLAELLEVLGKFSDAFAEYSAAGTADIVGTFSALADKPIHILFTALLSETSLANNAGTVAADGVTGKLDLDITLETNTTRLSLGFDSKQGEAYLEPVYANFSQGALSLQAEDVETPDFSAFRIPRFRVQQESLLDLGGSATLQFPIDEAQPVSITANVELRDSSIANLYDNFIKVAAAGTMLGDLETDGSLSGSVSLADSALVAASLRLDDVNLDDRGGRFAIYGLDGAVDWSADENHVPSVSRLSWNSGTVYNILIGGGAVNLQLGNDDVEMLAPLRLSVLGGALLINQLVLNNFGADDATGRLDAELEPIQLGQLTGAFGWPAFSGKLSGRLPLLQLAENTITVGGTLSARAFDGTIEVSKLSIEQPFGLVPRLQGELTIRDLDLQRVTEAFSFGLIQGRLSGDVAGLTMENWRPVAMDMNFYTPANDTSQHRISQRAVEDLASVGGGGAAAALSSGFLKFFDVFAYDQIGLRCVLKDGVCLMSGVGPAKPGPMGTGYYLVKGSGVPRIDVVGFRDRVSWRRLVQQLGAITQGGPPTVN